MPQLTEIARRIVAGLDVQPGELIQVRDHVARPDLLHEVLLAVDLADATPLVDHQSPAYLDPWLAEATPAVIEQSGRLRLRLLEQVDRVISLSGGIPGFALAVPAALAAWQTMDEELTQIEAGNYSVVCKNKRIIVMYIYHDQAYRRASAIKYPPKQQGGYHPGRTPGGQDNVDPARAPRC